MTHNKRQLCERSCNTEVGRAWGHTQSLPAVQIDPVLSTPTNTTQRNR